MTGPHGESVELKMSASFKDPVNDGVGQIMVVEHVSPLGEGLVGGEDHRPVAMVAVIDDMEEHIGRVG